ncbi:hypothetical protein BGZ65_004624 [Modicella reniformis]|uniref:DDE Tnp4 domain-containing protein n=1 Tax=Modicella reniformis TaxID=1440133 RepID=A0A9P6SM13_9FUNG|nr:hypothetical protein BGZ65_004624 [Modicella reniformis]
MGATAICDHRGIFRYFSTGVEFFQEDEYLLADAAYAISSSVIPRYKEPFGNEEQFNTLHAITRVKIEHSLGMLKLKFPSLQNSPVTIKKKRHIRQASYHSLRGPAQLCADALPI